MMMLCCCMCTLWIIRFETALPLQCSLRPGVSATSLPRLYFRLSESGRQLHIALQDLLLTDGATLCLLEGRPVHVATDLMQPSLTRIRLGTLALRSLYTVLDGASKRVGFANTANVRVFFGVEGRGGGGVGGGWA